MHFDLNLLCAVVLVFLPGALATAIIFRKRNAKKKSSRAPFDELQRRPAGEAIRIKLEELDDQINDKILGLAITPTFLAFALLIMPPKDWKILVFFFIVSCGVSAFFGGKLYELLTLRANYRLGFEGERYVGEELSRLRVLGFHIYHDVPFNGFNIDHVLVGSRGVFVVETKTRRKPVDEAGSKKYRVHYDGKNLQWPWGTDGDGIQQAKDNAKTLATWLRSAAGENVWATAILTMPGWMVERLAPSGGVQVLNPKEIYDVCGSQPETLNEPQIRRICFQLDQKCRIAVS